jgi:hypothetical protein
MLNTLFARFWADDAGALIASEFLFLATTLVIGTVVGQSSLRSAVNTEFAEFGNSLLALNQSFIIFGQFGCGAIVEGSQAIDTPFVVFNPTTLAPAFPSAIDVIPCH